MSTLYSGSSEIFSKMEDFARRWTKEPPMGCNSHSHYFTRDIIDEKTEERRLGFVKTFLILLAQRNSDAVFL